MACWEFQSLQHVAEKHGWHQFVSMQNFYNLIYREEEREMIPYCQDSGVGLIPVCNLSFLLTHHLRSSTRNKNSLLIKFSPSPVVPNSTRRPRATLGRSLHEPRVDGLVPQVRPPQPRDRGGQGGRRPRREDRPGQGRAHGGRGDGLVSEQEQGESDHWSEQQAADR